MPDQNQMPRYHRAVDVYRGRCPRSTFYLMVAQGKIRLIKVGRRSYCAETWDQIIERLGTEKPRDAGRFGHPIKAQHSTAQ
jgi:hypothetical protein